MTQVLKRNGRKQKFDEDKLKHSLEAAANEAGVPEDRCRALVKAVTREIADPVLKEKEVRSTYLRERILMTLDKAEPLVARAWRDYDRESKGLA